MSIPIFYDTEFLENGSTIELISIGLTTKDEDGFNEDYYAVNADMPFERILQHRWLVRNVLPHLPLRNRSRLDKWLEEGGEASPVPYLTTLELDRSNRHVKPAWVIANEVREFILGYPERELWAYYGAYDHVALCQLWGRMIDLPEGVPMFTHELMQLWEDAGRPEMPPQDNEHDALADARWNRALFQTCMRAAS